ncbi:MAG: HAMP domain-containing histidine kinase [Saccharofermentans sp.]|nr:HAMP domain-containing histidine kinase [Saccharofermentans sp.]
MMEVIIAALIAVCLMLIFTIMNMVSNMTDLRKQVHFISRNDTNKRITFYGKSRAFKSLAKDINDIIDSYREENEKIIKEDKEIKDTLTNMSHDIRTPLTSLKGYFELMGETDDPKEQEKCRSVIEERIESLSEILETMFLYTKVSNVNYKVELDPVDVSKVVLETMFSYYDDFVEKGQEVDVDVNEGLRIIASEQSLKRIMQNLIKNCLVHGNGDVKLELKPCDEGMVGISISNAMNPGENPDPDKVFDRFYKGDASRHNGSSGVGLSVVKKLVDSIGGDIKAEVKDRRFKISMKFKSI